MAITTHTTITGRVLCLEELGEEEHRLLLAVYQRFFEHHEWSEFGTWWMEKFRRSGVGTESPVYRVGQDLEARIGIAQGQVAVPDYRDYLADLIEERYGSRDRFCEQTSIDPADLSRALASDSEPSLQRLQPILEPIRATLVIRPEPDPDEWVEAEQKRIAFATLKAKDEERVHYLWLPRLYRKLPREFTPAEWEQVRKEYVDQGGDFDIDRIRCIVLGWTDGNDEKKVDEEVRLWKDVRYPAVELLRRITNHPRFEPDLLRLVHEILPAERGRMDEILEAWPDSPPAMARLLHDFRPLSIALAAVRGLLPPTTPDDSPPPEAGPGFGAIATNTELVGLERVARRGKRLAELLDEAERDLHARGWTVNDDGKLRELGSKQEFLTGVICGLHAYLRPIYRWAFGDTDLNPQQLREHISTLLSPFYSEDSVNPSPTGKLKRTIDNY